MKSIYAGRDLCRPATTSRRDLAQANIRTAPGEHGAAERLTPLRKNVRVDPGSVTFVLAEDSCYGVPAIEAFEASKSAALPKHERRIAASWTSTSIRPVPGSLRSNNSSMRRGRTAVPRAGSTPRRRVGTLRQSLRISDSSDGVVNRAATANTMSETRPVAGPPKCLPSGPPSATRN
jgi:hypothetical protein